MHFRFKFWSIYPYKTLENYIGEAPNFYDGSSFSWDENHVDMLNDYIVDEVDKNKFMLLVQKGDELLNPQEAIDKFDGAKVIAKEGGNHSFAGIELYFDTIKEFLLDE